MITDIRLLRSKLNKAAAQLIYLPQALGLVWDSARKWTVVWTALLTVQGILPVATVYLTKLLVDSLVASVASGGEWQTMRTTLIYVVLMAGVMLLSEILGSIAEWVRTAQAELVQDHINSLIHEKSLAVDMAFFESADYYDHLHRARSEASYRPVQLIENLGGLLQNGITLAAMLVVLLPFGLWLPIALLVSTLPAFYVVVRYAIRRHQWGLKATPLERRVWYYDSLLTDNESAAEMRLFSLGGHFREAYQTLRSRLRHEKLELERGQTVAKLGAGAIGLTVTGGVMAWMVWQALQGLVTLGSLALFYQAFNQGQRMMRTLLENTGQIYANILFLGNLFEFLALEPRVIDPPRPLAIPAEPRDIRFDHVTFQYPDSRRTALDDFNLTISAGRTTALVGPNGAGKSTLIKLLCRFYDPQKGSVTLDGVDLREFSIEELRRGTTVLFQEPVHYYDTVSRNIALGDMRSNPAIPEIRDAALAAGADEPIGKLPQGYETALGRWFGGLELSVGEWQRIALARAFLRKASIIILDEPTSAMDSWAEVDWMGRFQELVAGRTAVIITHRFTTAMRADVIHVMASGRIVESGCHQELLAMGGRYAESWNAQMRSERTNEQAGTEATEDDGPWLEAPKQNRR